MGNGNDQTMGAVARLVREVALAGQQANRRDYDTAEAAAGAEVSPKADIKEVAGVLKALVATMKARYGSGPSADDAASLVQRSLGLTSTQPVKAWREDAKALTARIEAAKVPWRQSKLDEQRNAHNSNVGSIQGKAPGVVASLIDDARSASRRSARAAAQATRAATEADWAERMASLRAAQMAAPPMHGAFSHPGWATWDGEPSDGLLAFEIGTVEPRSLAFSIYGRDCRPVPPDRTRYGAEPAVETIDISGDRLPAMIDLDRHAGLHTYDPALVNGLMLKALAALPGGRFTASVFDPQRLGESVSFLFGLGDHAESVIGLKVKSTERELNELLTELEEHLTFVTQKYLQGQFESLTAYNRAAGEIAEPYRALVMFDYPHGFVRAGGHVDEDLLARFAKIVGAGPRCGVYPLIVIASPPPPVNSSSVWDVLKRLPFVGPDTNWAAWSTIYAQLTEGGETAERAPIGSASEALDWAAVKDRKRLFVGECTATWGFETDPFPDDAFVARVLQSVERRLVATEDVRVDRERVVALYDQRVQREATRDRRSASTPLDLDDPATWWLESSNQGLTVPFGRSGASDVALLRLDSSTLSTGLIGGRPGAGKSVLFHSIILGACQVYSPEELELFLVDFKEGVEFKTYAENHLPHARVVAIESDREFGVAVLESVASEIERRGALFRESGGGDVNLATYRDSSGAALARQVLMIDEFHVLFERDDKLAGRAAELLDKIIRQGRAFGIHALLGSQTLAGTAALGRHTLNQVPIRIALQCSEADSQLLLAEDNPDARLLTRPGEGILNVAGGRKEANQRFQTAWVPPEECDAVTKALRQKADATGFTRRPIVFEGNVAAAIADTGADVIADAAERAPAGAVPLGLPLNLSGPLMAPLRRQPGGNVLVVGDDADSAALAAVAIARSVATGARVLVLDFLAADNPLEVAIEPLATSGAIEVARRRAALDQLDQLVKIMLERRDLDDARAQTHLVVVNGLHRARDLEPSYESDGPSGQFELLLREGPDWGIHVLATCDKVVTLDRRLSRSALREFAIRIAFKMGSEDSIGLLDSDLASQLKMGQAVFDDQDEVRTIKFRPWSMPSHDDLADLAAPSPHAWGS